VTWYEANRPARVAATAAVVLLIAAPGCGGDDGETDAAALEADRVQEAYVDDVRAAIGPVASQSQQLIAQVRQARSIGDLSRPLDEAEEGYRTAMRELEEIAPPADAAELHERLVETQRQIADATKEAERATAEDDRDGLDEFSEAGDRYARRSRALSERFSELGYEF
jgi:hypothetical protein